MKTITTLFLPAIILGAGIATFTLSRFPNGRSSVLGWILTLLGVLALGWVIATLVNFTVFAPVFWLISKLNKPNRAPEKKPDTVTEPK